MSRPASEPGAARDLDHASLNRLRLAAKAAIVAALAGIALISVAPTHATPAARIAKIRAYLLRCVAASRGLHIVSVSPGTATGAAIAQANHVGSLCTDQILLMAGNNPAGPVLDANRAAVDLGFAAGDYTTFLSFRNVSELRRAAREQRAGLALAASTLRKLR